MSKGDITTKIEQELLDRYPDSNDSRIINFITIALGNFFTTDQLEEFYEFLKDE